MHIEISLHLVGVIVKILIYLLFSRSVILTYSHLRTWTLILKRRVNSNLVTKHRFVFSMLHTHFFIIIWVNLNLHRSLSHVWLLRNRPTLFSLQLNILKIMNIQILRIINITVYGMFQAHRHLWCVLTVVLLMMFWIGATRSLRLVWLVCRTVIKESLSWSLVETALVIGGNIIETSVMSMRSFQLLRLKRLLLLLRNSKSLRIPSSLIIRWA